MGKRQKKRVTKKNLNKRRMRTRRTWVIAAISSPMYVHNEEETFRPIVVVCLERPSGVVVGHDISREGDEAPLLSVLEKSMREPMVGMPRQPDRLVVPTEGFAEVLRGPLMEAKKIEVVVGPTPEADKLRQEMRRARDESTHVFEDQDSYFSEGAVSERSLRELFTSAAALYRYKPWCLVPDEQVLRIDIPSLDIDGGVVLFMGGAGQSFGYMLFPSAASHQRFNALASAGPQMLLQHDIGPGICTLSYEAAKELPKKMRREAMQRGWPVAGPNAYPQALILGSDMTPVPLRSADVDKIATVTQALVVFFRELLEERMTSTGEPVPQNLQSDPSPLFVDEVIEPVKLVLDAQVPTMGSAGEPVEAAVSFPYFSDSAPIHEPPPSGLVHIDARWAMILSAFAEDNVGEAAYDYLDAFEEVDGWSLDMADAILTPWRLYNFDVDGRPIVSHALETLSPVELHGKPLIDSDARAFLLAQRDTYPSLWRVTSVEPGISVNVKDMWTGERRTVSDCQSSRNAKKDVVVLARVLRVGKECVFSGLHPQPLFLKPAKVVQEIVRQQMGWTEKVTAKQLNSTEASMAHLEMWMTATTAAHGIHDQVKT